MDDREQDILDLVSESNHLLEDVEPIIVKMDGGKATLDDVNTIFRNFHTIKGMAGYVGLANLQETTHQLETMLDVVRTQNTPVTSTIVDVLLESTDFIRSLLDYLAEHKSDEAPHLNAHDLVEKIAAVIESITGTPSKSEKPKKKRATKSPKPATAIDCDTATGPDIADMESMDLDALQAMLEATHGNKQPEPIVEDPRAESVAKPTSNATEITESRASTSIRVDTAKLDLLVDWVSELVIAESMVRQHPDFVASNYPEVEKAMLHLSKICKTIQEVTTSIRMIPIETLFQKIPRIIRDIAKKSHKEVSVEITGEDTEVDKSIIDLLHDPLIHMLRNAVDHGIESPSDREAVKKSPTGRVWVDAKHEGSEVWITITDDGKGLNADAILKKAIEKQLISSAQELSPEDIFQLIFLPGFSTAAQVTDLSGRGVGMDVVKKNIEQLRGKIEIQSSPGKGSTFVIKLPLTMAIIDGILVRVADSKFVMPLINIEQSFLKQDVTITRMPSGQRIATIRDNTYPIITLKDFFKMAETGPQDDTTLMLVTHDGNSVCLEVDSLLGSHQFVIKALSDYLGQIHGISGVTVLGSGQASLILDVAQIIETERTQ